MFNTMLSITFIGMTTVFLALIGLAVVVKIIEYFFAPKTKQCVSHKQKKAQNDSLEHLLPILTAAISAIEGDNNFRIIKIQPQSRQKSAWGQQSKLRTLPRAVRR